MTDIQTLDRPVRGPHLCPRSPVTFVRGEGCRLYDEAGKAYIDMGSGIAVNALGYCDEGWVAAVSAQAGHAQPMPATCTTPRRRRCLAQRAVRAHGHEARVLRQFRRGGQRGRHQGRTPLQRPQARRERAPQIILTLENSFHGRTHRHAWRPRGRMRSISDFGPFPEGFRACARQRRGGAENCAGRERRCAPC